MIGTQRDAERAHYMLRVMFTGCMLSVRHGVYPLSFSCLFNLSNHFLRDFYVIVRNFTIYLRIQKNNTFKKTDERKAKRVRPSTRGSASARCRSSRPPSAGRRSGATRRGRACRMSRYRGHQKGGLVNLRFIIFLKMSLYTNIPSCLGQWCFPLYNL